MAVVVSAPLPDLDLADSCTLTVDTGDVTAIIDSMAIHFRQDTPAEILAIQPVPPLLAYEPIPGEAAA